MKIKVESVRAGRIEACMLHRGEKSWIRAMVGKWMSCEEPESLDKKKK